MIASSAPPRPPRRPGRSPRRSVHARPAIPAAVRCARTAACGTARRDCGPTASSPPGRHCGWRGRWRRGRRYSARNIRPCRRAAPPPGRPRAALRAPPFARADMAGGIARAERLHLRHHREHLVELLGREARHDRAAMRPGFGEADRLELADRFADRRPRHLEFSRDRRLVERGARARACRARSRRRGRRARVRSASVSSGSSSSPFCSGPSGGAEFMRLAGRQQIANRAGHRFVSLSESM